MELLLQETCISLRSLFICCGDRELVSGGKYCHFSLSIPSEYVVIRSDSMISKLVGIHIDVVDLSEGRVWPRSCSLSIPVF